jgi:hypothetical protein
MGKWALVLAIAEIAIVVIVAAMLIKYGVDKYRKKKRGS